MGPLRGNEKAEYILKYVCSTNREKESESIRKVDGAPKPQRRSKGSAFKDRNGVGGCRVNLWETRLIHMLAAAFK